MICSVGVSANPFPAGVSFAPTFLKLFQFLLLGSGRLPPARFANELAFLWSVAILADPEDASLHHAAGKPETKRKSLPTATPSRTNWTLEQNKAA